MSGLLSKSTTLLKINDVIQNRSKQRALETRSTLTQEQLIDKLAKGAIDAETFRKQSQSLLQQSKPTLSINEQQIQRSLKM